MSGVTKENKVIVNIFGEEYPITGVSDPAHISKIADLIDSRMREASEGSQVSGRDKIAILAALSIASELDETRQRESFLTDDLDQTLDGLIERIDSAVGQ